MDGTELLAEVAGAGGDGNIPDDELDALKNTLHEIAGRAQSGRARDCLRTRYNRWSGQSIDVAVGAQLGRGESALRRAERPAVWWVDQLIREQETLRTVALARASVRCEARNGARDDEQARALTVLLRWLRDRIGPDWLEEHRKLTQYELGDSPAVALMRIWWRRESKLEMKRLDAAGLADLWQAEFAEQAERAGMELDPEQMAGAVADFAAALADPQAGDEELAAMLVRFFPRLTAARAAKACVRSGARARRSSRCRPWLTRARRSRRGASSTIS